jgi:hypothetical protein
MNASNFISELYTVILGRLYPKMLAEILYRKKFNKDINWNNPVNLNEKINWLAFNTDTSQWTSHTDKYLVREYVKRIGHAGILTKLLGVWDSPDSIDFEILPEKFVLKCNHDAGTVIVVENKNKINKNEIRNKLKVLLKLPFGIKTAEPHYLKIKRKIIAEEYIINNDPISDSLIDYKFWCFNGKASYCHVVYDKKVYENKKTDIYSLPDWKQQDNKLKNKTFYKSLPKPQNLNEMIEVAESLSNSFMQCRVDLYYCNNQIYFGELTFTAACGRITNYTNDFLIELGEKINIE